MTITTRRLGAVAAVVTVLVTLVWYVALFRPQSSRLSTAHTAYAAASAKADDLQTQIGALEALVRQIPADSARLTQLNAALPPTPDLKGLLTQLDALATRTGVQLTSLSPTTAAAAAGAKSAASSGGGTQTLTLPMSVSGSYAALTSFLTGLALMPRALTVTSMSLSPTGANSMTASLSTKVFYAS